MTGRATQPDSASLPQLSGRAAREWLDRALPAIWGVWLALTPIASFLVSPPRQAIYLYGDVDTRNISPAVQAATYGALALGAVPILLSLFLRKLQPARALPFLALSLPILALIAASLIHAGASPRDVVVVASGAYIFGLIAILCAANLSGDEVRRFLVAVAVFHALSIVVALADGNFVNGRFQGRIGSNFWGGIAAYSIIAGLAARRVWVRFAIAVPCMAALLLGQNRSSLIAMLAGLALVGICAFVRASRVQRLGYLLAGAIGAIVLTFTLPTILSDVLLVTDSRRGLGSGGTGRFDAWIEAWHVFLENPLLGVGYRHHEDFIISASSAHQAYLATLADLGIFGLAAYLLFLLSGLVAAVATGIRARAWEMVVLGGIIFAYAVQGFFEQRAVNFANSVSLLAMIAIGLAVTRRSLANPTHTTAAITPADRAAQMR